MGDHQLLLKAAVHYQGVIRVPCIWSDPADHHQPASTDNLAGTIDLPTSILDRAGVGRFNGMQGKNLSAIAAGDEVHDSVVIEESQQRGYMGLEPSFRARTMIADKWRLTFYSDTDWGELYDLENDPLEFDNLWHDPAHAAKRAALVEQLARRMMDLTDTSPLTIGHGP